MDTTGRMVTDGRALPTIAGICLMLLAASFATGSVELDTVQAQSARGTSVMVCTFTQSCDAYNTYSGKCAGQRDGSSCTTCGNASTVVTYLDMIRSPCTAPPAPGLKYGNNPPANVNCGNTSSNAECKNQQCTGTNFTGLACSQPKDVVSQ